jgi:N-ethylmaleimide reductase
VLRKRFAGALILNGGYDENSGNAVIAQGRADLIAFGVPFSCQSGSARPVCPTCRTHAPHQATFYAGEEKGYVDYPALAGA